MDFQDLPGVLPWAVVSHSMSLGMRHLFLAAPAASEVGELGPGLGWGLSALKVLEVPLVAGIRP